MLNLKTKIVIVGLICVMPTYMMGRCNGQLHNKSLNVTCQGKSEQIQLSSVSYELIRKNNALKDSILNNSDTLSDIRTKTSNILPTINMYANQAKEERKRITSEIERLNNFLQSQTITRKQRQEFRSEISRLKSEKFAILERHTQELYQLYQNHKQETSYLESQLHSSMNDTYRTKRELSVANNRNKNLKSFIYNATDTFSNSLANSFSNYSECIKKNDLLSTFTFSEIYDNRNQSSSNNNFFSSSNSSSISTLPGLSSSGISSSSLGSCANQFQSLKKRFTLYEVALNLYVNPDERKRRIVVNFFKVYKGITPSQNSITRFIQAFNHFPKNGLLELIRNIDAEMQNY